MTQSDIIVPPDFIDKFVWPPFKHIAADGAVDSINDLSSDHPALPQTYAFPESVLSEVLAAASYAFSPGLQLGGIEPSVYHSLTTEEGLPEEPSICLFTPYAGCHEIIDSMIQSVASQLNADVVVLDALELALGEFGALGNDIGQAISAAYEPKPKLYSSRIQGAFDAIVNVSNKVPPCTGGDLTEASKCRFIYLRDFGSIARSAKPFMARLLNAIRVRRSAALSNEDASNSSSILHPTVLIMGFDEPSTTGSEVDFDINSPYRSRSFYGSRSSSRSRSFSRSRSPYRFRNPIPSAHSKSSIFSKGGDALRKTLPALDNKLFRLKPQFSKILLEPLPAAFFYPLVSTSSPVETTALPSAKNIVIPALHEECICLIPRNFQQDGFRDLTRHTEIRRKTDVQNTLMVLFLRQQGFLVAENLNLAASADASSGVANPNSVLLSDVLGSHPDTSFAVAVSRIATIAIGLAHQRPHAQTAIRIDAEDISKAQTIFIENCQTFSHWADEVEGRKGEVREGKLDGESDAGQTSAKNSAGEKERKDPIVEGVKHSRDLNEHEKTLLQCIVDCVSLPTTFDNVCIDPEIIQSLNDVVSLPLRHPALFKTGILSRESIGGVLLYGSPGTGKTMVCRALARECGARMLQVRPSDIMNKWFGNSENLARNIFSLAHRLAPCVIFFDEMDSLFRSRTSGDSDHLKRDIVNEFLQAMDGLQSAQKNRDAGVVVVGATNRPFDLDEAVLRRLPTRLLVKLPDETRRKEILRVHLQGEAFPDVQLDEIARRTDGYSGSDLKNLCVSAATEAAKESVRNVISDGTAVQAGRSDVPSRVLAPKHFEHAFTRVSPSTKNNSELDRWHKSFARPTSMDGNSELDRVGSNSELNRVGSNSDLDGWYKSLVGRTSADGVGSV